VAADGRSVTMEEVALDSLHLNNQHQIMATASANSVESPMPTAAQFAEIVVDTQTGKVQVERLLMVADCGRVVNPIAAAGQVEGGVSMALGYALTEEMLFDDQGQPLNASLAKYKIPRASNSPATDVMFVQTDETSGPFGAKSIGEVAVDGVAPAMASALHDATGVWMREFPYTPVRVLAALKEAGWK
jgi:putative selenate reductase molybdopterin-binding subunit